MLNEARQDLSRRRQQRLCREATPGHYCSERIQEPVKYIDCALNTVSRLAGHLAQIGQELKDKNREHIGAHEGESGYEGRACVHAFSVYPHQIW